MLNLNIIVMLNVSHVRGLGIMLYSVKKKNIDY
jgi:hypothetical protein